MNFGGLIWGDLQFWNLQSWSNFIYLFELVTLRILCVQLKRLKSLIIGGARLGEIPLWNLQFLLHLVYFLYLYISKI